ncbi:MAG: UDP-N-acetylmuramoyl-L-alanyl-D-glutamate--2,6-diaminopimelate ligase [Chloroflexi bacterium]|nr:MAG: UDP-N-acetylmuramoyl-L-alanyl-D-glutamate--2,6-diaminopimelate ligase [Chloroflexota bacterium]
MRLSLLLAAAGARLDEKETDVEVRSIAYDSRRVEPGALFVAIPGFHRDGHEFVADALSRGAVAVVAERAVRAPAPVAVVADARLALSAIAAEFFDHPTRRLPMVGVTGTDGKTTTVHLVSDVLEAAGERTGFQTTVDFKLCDNTWANESRQTTQEALEVQQFFAELLVAGGTWGVLEATSHALTLKKLTHVELDVAVFTNLTPEHLDFHGTMQDYLAAKGILFEMLDRSADKGVPKAAIVNADDPHWRYLADRTAHHIITYGIDALADVQGQILAESADGTRIALTYQKARAEIALPLIGRFNVSNALAAAAAGLAVGATLDAVRLALERATPVAGRLERVEAGQPFSVVVDYAHTPDSLRKILTLLRPLTKGELIAVFGSAGERDRTKRAAMGKIAAELADYFVITQEDPRLEDRAEILREIERGAIEGGATRGQRYEVIDDRKQAIAHAINRAKPGDTVVASGKGHERSIIEGEKKTPWDEAAAAREALRARGYA